MKGWMQELQPKPQPRRKIKIECRREGEESESEGRRKQPIKKRETRQKCERRHTGRNKEKREG
jgi:hypothetical protein